MTVNDLKLQIVSNNLSNKLYIFYGEEYIVQRTYIQKISEVTESDIEYIDSVEDVLSDSGSSLFSFKKCYVCVDDAVLLKSNNLEKDFKNILQALEDNILILQYSKIDKRSKFYNFITKDKDLPFSDFVAVEFEYLHPVVLEKHILEKVKLTPEAVKKLIEVCEQDYGRILLEVDKIDRYANCENLFCNEAFTKLLKNKIIYQPPGDMIFSFVDAVLANKPKTAFSLLQECKEIGEPSLRLLLVLFTNIRHLLQVQSCETNIAETTGLSSWEIRNVQNYQGIYRNSELVRALHLIQETEKGIKTGQIEDAIAVDYVLVNIL